MSLDRTYLYGGMCNFTALCSFLYTIRSLNLNVVTSITYLKPLLVILLAVVFLREKFTARSLLAFILGALGSYVITKPQAMHFKYSFQLLYAFIPAIGWAAYDFVLKKQVMRDRWLKQAFGTVLVATIISLPFGIYNWSPLSSRQCFIFLSLGCLAVLNKIASVNAFYRLPLVMLMPLEFTRLIFVSSIAYLFLGEKLVSTTIFGFFLIAAGTIVLAYKARKKSPLCTE
jgi:drug/metabolite transporter (DMT)-like permease